MFNAIIDDVAAQSRARIVIGRVQQLLTRLTLQSS